MTALAAGANESVYRLTRLAGGMRKASLDKPTGIFEPVLTHHIDDGAGKPLAGGEVAEVLGVVGALGGAQLEEVQARVVPPRLVDLLQGLHRGAGRVASEPTAMVPLRGKRPKRRAALVEVASAKRCSEMRPMPTPFEKSTCRSASRSATPG